MESTCSALPLANQLAQNFSAAAPFVVVGAIAFGFDVLVSFARRYGAETATVWMLKACGALVLAVDLVVYLLPVLSHAAAAFQCWW
jgi:sterol desaturase/sphingolipid hydroxylase (fatty acid hydroxylase superfamily)